MTQCPGRKDPHSGWVTWPKEGPTSVPQGRDLRWGTVVTPREASWYAAVGVQDPQPKRLWPGWALASLPRWRTWGLAAAVPAVGLVELLAHVVQISTVVPERDWRAARAYVAAQAKPEDLIAFTPRWADPLGREFFGPGLATLEREARDDETRFPRAFEVSIRGFHLPALSGWKRTDRRTFGGVSVTTLENPAPATVLSDLVSMLDPQHLGVSLVQGADRESDCSFVPNASVVSGGLGAGMPLSGGPRFVCPGNAAVATTIATDLDYYPHRCIYAAPPGDSTLRMRFSSVAFGRALSGHHDVYIETGPDGLPLTIVFKTDETVIGRATYRDGDGWKTFEFDTSTLAGKRADLVVEVSSGGGGRRGYCFEASTR